jgi:acetyl esterase/lipase
MPALNPNRGLEDSQIPGSVQVTVVDFTIKARDGYEIPVRSYIPVTENQNARFPAMTWAHHGGWRLGNVEVDDAVCRYISVHATIVIINIGYRLTPEYRFPSALNDVFDTVKWASLLILALGCEIDLE